MNSFRVMLYGRRTSIKTSRVHIFVAMQIRKSHILLLVAYGLALLHSTVPHRHSTIRTTEPKFEVHTIDHASLFGLVQAAFATDLGCGHLESFAKSDGGTDVPQTFSDVPILFLASLYFTEDPVINTGDFFGAFIEKLHTRVILLSTGQLRAPPVLA